MSINNVKTFGKIGRADVFLLDPNGTYTVTTLGADGGASDVHVWVADNDLASNDDPTLTDNWTLLQDTGASGESSAQAVTAGSKKLFVDVIDPLADNGALVTVSNTGELSAQYDKSQGLLSANNQRQKFSSQVRRLN